MPAPEQPLRRQQRDMVAGGTIVAGPELWRIVLRRGSPETEGKLRLLRCGGCKGE
jgi:hypothetical protein